MRWQRPARAIAAMTGIACVVALVVYSRKRPPSAPTPAILTNPGVNSKGKNVVSFRLDLNAGKESLKIEADEQTEFADGRMRLDHVHTRRHGRPARCSRSGPTWQRARAKRSRAISRG